MVDEINLSGNDVGNIVSSISPWVGGLEWKIGKLQGPSISQLWFSPWLQYWLVYYFCGCRSGSMKKLNSVNCCFILIWVADRAFATTFQATIAKHSLWTVSMQPPWFSQKAFPGFRGKNFMTPRGGGMTGPPSYSKTYRPSAVSVTH